MTEQEVFNKVWDHIITQGNPSVNKDGNCLYRGPNGLKCAAGILLTDEQAVESDKVGANWSMVLDDYPELRGLPNFLINDLQLCHDNVACYSYEDFVEDFKERARFVAEKYKLTTPEENV
jgi:hypothetical protein